MSQLVVDRDPSLVTPHSVTVEVLDLQADRLDQHLLEEDQGPSKMSLEMVAADSSLPVKVVAYSLHPHPLEAEQVSKISLEAC